MNYNIDPKTLKKAAPRELTPNPVNSVVTNTAVFEGKPTDTGSISNALTGLSGKLTCYTERLRPDASHDTVCHSKKTKVVSVISGVLNIEYYEQDEQMSKNFKPTKTLSISVGEFVQLNPGDIYRLHTKVMDCIFSVVQEYAYEYHLNVILPTKASGVDDITVPSRYKSKAREQLALLNPKEETQPKASNTPNVDWNLKPLTDSELEALS